MSATLIGVLILCGLVAVHGGPLQGAGPLIRVDAPDWVARAAGTGTFPAFLMRPDGSTVQIGRAIRPSARLRAESSPPYPLDLILFPDLTRRALAGTAVFILPTDPRALWATVPRASKGEIATRAQTLARLIQRQVVSILGNPAFVEDYQPALRALLRETADGIRSDPRLDLIDSVIDDLLQQEDMDALGAVLMPVVLPELRRAVFETLTPHWGTLGGLLSSGHSMDSGPFRNAAGRVITNPEVQKAVMTLMGHLASDERVWQIGALTADVFADALTRNPRFHPLVTALVNDPRFAAELHRVEAHITTFATGLFDLVVGRGARAQTDPLAVQMLRYVLINRLGAVVVLVHEDDLYKVSVDRYRVPILSADPAEEGSNS